MRTVFRVVPNAGCPKFEWGRPILLLLGFVGKGRCHKDPSKMQPLNGAHYRQLQKKYRMIGLDVR